MCLVPPTSLYGEYTSSHVAIKPLVTQTFSLKYKTPIKLNILNPAAGIFGSGWLELEFYTEN